MNIKEALDLKDRKILYQLDINSRQSNSEIGKKVHLNKQVVDYRIKRLQKEGIIKQFTTVIDSYKLGYSKYKLYLSLENTNQSILQRIIEFLEKHPKTEWVATCSGKYDIIVGFFVKDVYEFHDALKEFDEKFSKFISGKETAISLGVPHWRKEYLLDNEKHERVIIQGNSKGIMEIDEIDEKLIKLLVNNARMPITDIANKLKITPRIAQYRMKDLQKSGIILFHRVMVDLNKFNWIFCKALLRFKNINEEKYKQFFSHLDSIKNLTYSINTIGSWDIELDFEIQDFNSFHLILLDIRNKFSDLIKNYDFVVIMNEDKLDYYPGAMPIFKQNKT